MDITKAAAVYVSTSKNADYVEATPHDGAVKFVRADLHDPAAIRAAALREAAEVVIPFTPRITHEQMQGRRDVRNAITALINKEPTK